MSDTRATHARVRLALVLAAGAVTLSWLWGLFLFPEGWRDRHGYNQLGALILTSALHWVVCLPLTVAYMTGVLGPWLPRLAYAAPLAHVTGSSINAPGCWPFFVAPSVAILVVGVREVRSARSFAGSCGSGPGAASNAEPGAAPDRRGL